MASVALAADRLMGDAMAHLRQINPEVCVEFRQPYVGPAMRKYGNMFRAGDCPGDSVTNRVATIDIRLLCGDTACHGDMLMWHKSEPPSAAALQLLGSFFAVPQISVRLDEIPEAHRDMLRFYLDFWIKHRHVLLGGKLSPASPVSLYPAVSARDETTCIAVQYERGVVHLPGPLPAEIYVINATGGDEVALEMGEPFDRCQMQALDCTGKSVAKDNALLPEGLYSLPCPPAGMIVLRKA
jgi:alpha-galactosidase